MKYLFKFNYFLFDLPYINRTIELFPPWTYFISIGSCILYLILIRTVFPLYKSKFAQQSFAIVHYGLLCFYSLVACLTVFFYLIQTNEIIHWSELLCSPIPSWLRILSISFTLSKIWEWFDTAILIAKGHSLSKIGFLHIYHHATTFVLFLSIMNLPGSEKTGILFNGFVHALMYYHFAFRLPKICRPVITTLHRFIFGIRYRIFVMNTNIFLVRISSNIYFRIHLCLFIVYFFSNFFFNNICLYRRKKLNKKLIQTGLT